MVCGENVAVKLERLKEKPMLILLLYFILPKLGPQCAEMFGITYSFFVSTATPGMNPSWKREHYCTSVCQVIFDQSLFT